MASGPGIRLQRDYHRFKDLILQTWNYHFEFLNLGYAAYLDYFGFCKEAFPSIPDLAIAKMVAGVEVDLFRPNEELKVLAKLAVDTGLARAFDDPDNVDLDSDAGRAWQAAYDEVADPWFNFSSGNGFYHFDKTWRDYPEIPHAFIRDYITKIEAGADITRPIEAITAERDRVVAEYRDLLDSDEDREAFDGKLGLGQGRVPLRREPQLLHRALDDVGGVGARSRSSAPSSPRRGCSPQTTTSSSSAATRSTSSCGTTTPTGRSTRRRRRPSIGGRSSPGVGRSTPGSPNGSRRKALGEPPEVITEPFTIMLWGITSDSVQTWLGSEGDDGDGLTGMAASPGVAEGKARLVFKAEDVGDIEDGEILVAPITAPSWAPAFPKIQACVTDIGGMMSHAAIVCREYGVPAVTGTGFGTNQIETGQMIRVDGSAGTVEIVD